MDRAFDVSYWHRRKLPRWRVSTAARGKRACSSVRSCISIQIGPLEINHRVLDAGEPFTATLEILIERFPQHAEFIHAFDVLGRSCLVAPYLPPWQASRR
jgi:hypothetical protein